MSYIVKVDEEGVALLRGLASQLEINTANMVALVQETLNQISEFEDLGPHKSSIVSVMTSIMEQLKQALVPIHIIEEKIMRKADAYMEIIEDDVFSGWNCDSGDDSDGEKPDTKVLRPTR